jgi:hypothetical protein
MRNSKRSLSRSKRTLNRSVTRKTENNSVQTYANPSPRLKPRKGHRRTVSDTCKLAPLQGKHVEKAPTYYFNQIFRDVYDELGNHDRILVTEKSIEVYEEINKGNFVTFNNRSDVSTEKFIVPDNSYKSCELTCNNFRDELWKKLENLQQLVKEKDENEFLRNITFLRNRVNRNQAFVFPVILDLIK